MLFTPNTPLNLRLMDTDAVIARRGIMPVTSHLMFEPSTNKFHPDGLYSEEIFGEMFSTSGVSTRKTRFGYIDLKAPIIHPHVWSVVTSLRSYYEDIAMGSVYAIWDPEVRDYVVSSKGNVDARTGYSYFLSHVLDIDYQRTDSSKRDKKIELFEKYSERELMMSKYLVQPAGIRDVEIREDGSVTSEEINSLYLSLLQLTGALPESIDPDLLEVYDSVRYAIERKALEIWEYTWSQWKGKRGYAQGKHARRAITWSSRNVVSTASLTAESPTDPSFLKHDETGVSLYQAMKIFQPVVRHRVITEFIEPIVSKASQTVLLVDPSDYGTVYVDLSDKEYARWNSPEGIDQLVKSFENDTFRTEPVSIKGKDGKSYYLLLVYDEGDTVRLTRSEPELAEEIRTQTEKTMMPSDERIEESVAHMSSLIQTLDPKDYILIGSAALVGYGVLDTNNDIDILVSPETKEQMSHWDPSVLEHLDVYESITTVYTGKMLYDEVAKQVHTTPKGYRVLPLNLVKSHYEYLAKTKDNSEKYEKRIETIDTVATSFTSEKLRPLTYLEMFYLAAIGATTKKHVLTTRYPAVEAGSTFPAKTKIYTTSPSRVVRLIQQSYGTLEQYTVCPHYPILGNSYIDTTVVHPGKTQGMGMDFDGDAANVNSAMSVESNEEIDKYLHSAAAYVKTNMRFQSGLLDDLGSTILWSLTRDPN